MAMPIHAFCALYFSAFHWCPEGLPVGIYWFLFQRAAISRFAVLGPALALIAMAGVDVLLLQSLADISKKTPSVWDDTLFFSGVSVALYLLPVVLAGIGVNIS